MDNKILLKIYTYTGYSLIISLFYFAPIFLLYFLKDNIGIGSYIIAYLMIFYLTFIIDTVFKRSAVKDKIKFLREVENEKVNESTHHLKSAIDQEIKTLETIIEHFEMKKEVIVYGGGGYYGESARRQGRFF